MSHFDKTIELMITRRTEDAIALIRAGKPAKDALEQVLGASILGHAAKGEVWNRTMKFARSLARRHKVAVYGSLLAGLHNHDWLEGSRLIDGDGLRDFVMFDLGSFPAIVPGAGGRVYVEVYEVSDEVLTGLDSLEGHPNFYIRTPVRTESGREVFVYVLNMTNRRGDIVTNPQVVDSSGLADWRTYYTTKMRTFT